MAGSNALPSVASIKVARTSNTITAGMANNFRLNMLEATSKTTSEVKAKHNVGQPAAHFSSLDLLRGVSALAVAIPHFFLLSDTPFVVGEILAVIAVEVFFVLSGFVLAEQILLVLRGEHRNALRTFLVRRWMRTVPSYVAALLLASVLFGKLGSPDSARYLLYAQNLFAQHNLNDYFPIAWSLSVEEWFYVIFPGALLVTARVLNLRRLAHWVLLTVAFIALVTAARAYFPDWNDWGANVRRVTAFRIDSIAYGFLLYVAVRALPCRIRLVATLPMFLVATAAVSIDLKMIDDSQSAAAKAAFPFLAALFGSSAILLSLSLPEFLPGMRRLSAFLATISYAVYLYHLIVLQLVNSYMTTGSTLSRFAVYLGATILVTALISFGIEQPILASRPRYRRLDKSSSGV
jgi:peptidoglycan/LPS O-acetylase OafA/YrhL